MLGRYRCINDQTMASAPTDVRPIELLSKIFIQMTRVETKSVVLTNPRWGRVSAKFLWLTGHYVAPSNRCIEVFQTTISNQYLRESTTELVHNARFLPRPSSEMNPLRFPAKYESLPKYTGPYARTYECTLKRRGTRLFFPTENPLTGRRESSVCTAIVRSFIMASSYCKTCGNPLF